MIAHEPDYRLIPMSLRRLTLQGGRFGEVAVDPIDYFMSIFVGMSVGLVGLTYVFL
jgi:hypothetical protein